MSKNWVKDIENLHEKFGVNEWMQNAMHEAQSSQSGDRYSLLKSYLSFRLMMTFEEMGETLSAATVQRDPEEVVDGLIDMCVFALGTLEVMGVDAGEAWDRVFDANMEKEVGVKEGRPNPWGFPDMVKPKGWKAPTHVFNHGFLQKILSASSDA